MVVTTPFQTLFAVPMTCESCIKDISTSLHKLSGIESVSANLKEQLVTISGTAPPSAIVAAIQQTGRDAILRGSGGSNSAAVSILETHNPTTPRTEVVKGLARIVQVSPTLTLFDITIRGLSPGLYQATIRETGDISRGAISTKGIWDSPAPTPAANGNEKENGVKKGVAVKRGVLGTVQVGKDGVGAVFIDKPIQIWEMIGRGFVVSRLREGKEEIEKNDEDTLVGVIARSAGVWDNDKTVCSCSGKTLWEERVEVRGKGML